MQLGNNFNAFQTVYLRTIKNLTYCWYNFQAGIECLENVFKVAKLLKKLVIVFTRDIFTIITTDYENQYNVDICMTIL